ncbi:N-glycosylase/DNA lyase [Smittium mucronatum]|uniref:DNA-(apurinic or apyrimidinic site) lyase n=1 Tax=Smittium mucronatum TaxID=133383 RepID=A0A1R0GQX2_9FUNG|nr:N-glycosylase/DNA lyase [Smittium mucronatum]
MCLEYGNKVDISDSSINVSEVHLFPELHKLAEPGVEERLRELGFGYRAKYIYKSAKHIYDNYKNPEEWFDSLINLDYQEAKKQLTSLTGVGSKVADCICLMSLNKTNAIPVDTHILQVATRDYTNNGLFIDITKSQHSNPIGVTGVADNPMLVSIENSEKITKAVAGAKKISPIIYDYIFQMFCSIFGPFSGWAQTILFISDLGEASTPDKKKSKSRKSIKFENNDPSKILFTDFKDPIQKVKIKSIKLYHGKS